MNVMIPCHSRTSHFSAIGIKNLDGCANVWSGSDTRNT